MSGMGRGDYSIALSAIYLLGVERFLVAIHSTTEDIGIRCVPLPLIGQEEQSAGLASSQLCMVLLSSH